MSGPQILAAAIAAFAFTQLATVMCAGAINHVGRRERTRMYERSATNLTPFARAHRSEAPHHNDRGAPTSAQCSSRPGEVDPGPCAVRALVSIAPAGHDDLHLTRTA